MAEYVKGRFRRPSFCVPSIRNRSIHARISHILSASGRANKLEVAPVLLMPTKSKARATRPSYSGFASCYADISSVKDEVPVGSVGF